MPRIHRLSGTDTLNDTRFACKMMASLLKGRNLRYGRYPLRRHTEKVHEGTVLLSELNTWYDIAVTKLRSPS